MKCVITLIQNKRAIFPYLFGKYCFPLMRNLFPGEMKLIHIHHDSHRECWHSDSNHYLKESHLQNVNRFWEEGKYPNALRIRHKEQYVPYAPLPSYRLAIQTALEEGADLHVWLEDDAVLYDPECDRWAEKIGDAEIGIWSQKEPQIFTYAVITTPPYDRRLLDLFDKWEDIEPCPDMNEHGSQLEYVFAKAVTTKARIGVDSWMEGGVSQRVHYGQCTPEEVVDWLRERVPVTQEDGELVRMDYPVEAIK